MASPCACGSQCLRPKARQCHPHRCAAPAAVSVVSTRTLGRQACMHQGKLHLQPLRSSASSTEQVTSLAAEEAATRAGAAAAAPESPSAQPQLTTVVLRKPVGIVFAQNKGGAVFVEELTAGGNAEQSGAVAIGDVLASCSAVVLKVGKEGEYERRGHGARPYDNFEKIEFSCEGQAFKTVMNALKSNNTQWGYKDVTLTFRKPAHA